MQFLWISGSAVLSYHTCLFSGIGLSWTCFWGLSLALARVLQSYKTIRQSSGRSRLQAQRRVKTHVIHCYQPNIAPQVHCSSRVPASFPSAILSTRCHTSNFATRVDRRRLPAGGTRQERYHQVFGHEKSEQIVWYLPQHRRRRGQEARQI